MIYKSGHNVTQQEVKSMKIERLRLMAFRYALGRRTYIVSEMVEELIAEWDSMKPWHMQIQDDIRHAIEHDLAGDNIDVKEWEKILRLSVKRN